MNDRACRNLSQLQRGILILAYENRGRHCRYGDTRNHEVLLEIYQIPRYYLHCRSYHFRPTPKTRAAGVSTCKSFDRLVRRGLAMRRYNHGILLTARGAATARAIMAGDRDG
jgi:hypothetical protein